MMKRNRMSMRACVVGLVGLMVLSGCGDERERIDPSAPSGAATQQAAQTPAPPTTPSAQTGSASRRAAWQGFIKEVGGSWQVHEHPTRRVPQRVYGSGLEVPGSIDRPEVAADFAAAFLARHAELLAPGAKGADLVQVSNVLSDGVRSVGFYQHADGMRVLGGQVSLRFKKDRLIVLASEAFPNVQATRPAQVIADAQARDIATSWIGREAPGARALTAEAAEGPFVLPLDGKHHVVLRVKVAAEAPLGRWDVFVDAADGTPIHHASTLMFEEAQLSYSANVRNPGSGREDFPASLARISVNDDDQTADAAGLIAWEGTGEPATITATAISEQVRIYTEVGDEASITFEGVNDQDALVWNAEDDELVDAQVSAFVHLNRVKDYARGFAPDLDWLGAQAEALVNIDDECNAVSDGLNVYFFRSSSICENTALIADVVFHEFGHSLHNQSLIPGVGAFEGSLSEGISDYLSATITDDPAMARGFFKGSDDPLRHIDPSGFEQVWPDDVIAGDVHHNGRIISGALWDLRKLLVEQYGPEEGVALSDRFYYEATRRASDIPTMFVEVLTTDDDDGDLTNGTPNTCAIVEAFGAHGLASLDGAAPTLQAVPPTQDGFQIDFTLNATVLSCLSEATPAPKLTWQLRDAPETGGELAMERGEGGTFSARIPDQPAGQVVQYRIEVGAFGGIQNYPKNPADPLYEFYVGDVETIYCTSFDDDDAIEGWESGLDRGEDIEGANDWQFGPAGGLSFDPTEAFSEPNVFGNDLSPDTQWNGAYQADRTNYGLSPAIDVSGYVNVRLQYMRWLSVEDARYDTATIYANDQAVWQNVSTNTGELHHIDREWRFHDVALDEAIGGVGNVRIKFEIDSDGGLEFGGWNVDDFCVVGVRSTCGNGEVDGMGEVCDDGAGNSDTTPDACRTDCQPAACGDGVVDSGEACDDGNMEAGDGCDACVEEVPCDGGFIPAGEVCDDGANNGGTTGNNNTSGGNNNTSSNNGTSGGDTTGETPVDGGSGFVNNAGGSSDSGCSQVGHGDTLPLSALALVLGAFMLRRRRNG